MLELFAKDPAGWTAVIIAVIVAVCSAVLWKRIRSGCGAIARWVRQVWRKLPFEIRRRNAPVPVIGPIARFTVQPVATSDRGTLGFAIVKLNDGVANNLRISSPTRGVVLGRTDFWPGPFNKADVVEVLAIPDFGMADEIVFELKWENEASQPRMERIAVTLRYGQPVQQGWFAAMWKDING